MTIRSSRGPAARALCACALLSACGLSSTGSDTTSPADARHPVPVAALPEGGQHTPGCQAADPPVVGVTEVVRTPVGERSWSIELASEAMQRNESVMVTLPRDYDPSGRTRYPVLLLFHGSAGSERDYIDHDLEALTADYPVIIVTPNGGPEGSYADWYGALTGNPEPAPAWESFHMREVVPFIRAQFPVREDRGGWATAGLSAGGNAAMKYLTANPQLARAAGAFSGAVDTTLDYPYYPTLQTVLGTPSLLPTQGPTDLCRWGDPILQKAWWFGDVPTHHAENLAFHELWVTSGNGLPGEYDLPAQVDPIETHTYLMALSFLEALDHEHIGYTEVLYGAGTHSWPYWQRALVQYLDWLIPRFDDPAPTPDRFDHRSTRANFSAWGWHFAIHRDVKEFVYLEAVTTGGLVVTGSGRLELLTPPFAEPGARYRITTGRDDRTVVADAAGRLLFVVDLGPSHSEHQRDFPAEPPSDWPTRQVTIQRIE